MVAYNFVAQFADDVEQGRKLQTIRARRKSGRHARPGDPLQLYTGMRTKACRKLRDAVCTEALEIKIEAGAYCTKGGSDDWNVRVSLPPMLDEFARRDGFADWEALRDWFASQHGLPFIGVLIRWLKEAEGRDGK